MTDAPTTTRLPQEWMTFDWILEQSDQVGMDQRELFVVDAAVRLIRHILRHGNEDMIQALTGKAVKDLELVNPDDFMIKPLALVLALDDPHLLGIAKMYGQLTMTDETIGLCQRFLKNLRKPLLPNDVAMTPEWTFAQTAITPFSQHDLEFVDEVVCAIASAALINGNTVQSKLRGLMVDNVVTPMGLDKFLRDRDLIAEVRGSQRNRTSETSLEYCRVFLSCIKDAA